MSRPQRLQRCLSERCSFTKPRNREGKRFLLGRFPWNSNWLGSAAEHPRTKWKFGGGPLSGTSLSWLRFVESQSECRSIPRLVTPGTLPPAHVVPGRYGNINALLSLDRQPVGMLVATWLVRPGAACSRDALMWRAGPLGELNICSSRSELCAKSGHPTCYPVGHWILIAS
jgi:hypothetical protein